MLRRLKFAPLTASRLILGSLMLLLALGCGKSLSNAKSIGGKSSPIQEVDPAFAVPDGNPDVIMDFIKDIKTRRPKLSNQEEKVVYVKKAERALVEAADKILAQEANDDLLYEATVMKLSMFINPAMNPQLAPEEAEAISKDAVELVNRFRQDKRKMVADTAYSFQIAARIPSVRAMSSEERAKFADDAIQIVTEKPSPIAIGTVDFLAEQLVMSKEPNLAISLCTQTAKFLEESSNEEFKTFARGFRSKLDQISHNTPGVKIEIEGDLLTGGKLDWESYRGKVVLVDFWATWCGPCVAELPNVVECYRKYHDRGFEVVGVSLDRELKQLQSFLEAKPLPWVQIFSEQDQDTRGAGNELAERFGVSSIPRAYLVDREGKLVSSNARGPELDRLLKTLFQ